MKEKLKSKSIIGVPLFLALKNCMMKHHLMFDLNTELRKNLKWRKFNTEIIDWGS
jgi:hypothetical protein